MLIRIVVVVLALSIGTAFADKIRIGTEGAYPPFNVLDENSKPQGFDIDIANALCAKMQVECEYVIVDWDGIIPALLAKKFDMLVASMSITDERRQVVDFTEPYYTNKLQFVAPKGVDFKTDNASLKGKIIGVQRATIAGIYLEDHLDKVVEIKRYDTQENAYLDLAAGRLDGILADIFVQWEWLNNSELGAKFEFKGKPIFEEDKVGIAVRKGDPLKLKLDEALRQIIADGTYQKINEKYFPFTIR